ncbi:probable phosphoglycerate mutase [Candidatus Planktophila lacus]|uniref:MSMEG_4193 family putative phosphomutase n=1 Tax=Candidatus Planktophila lacus TaxID=1884913 RepID=UPI000BACC87D|nr:MSMEG_4193 family putative phosphomutase [Candidatus Planktophila lacus]ASY25075.1 probable phosphoglycerate mutase [Candidatus Planktophila lacus]
MTRIVLLRHAHSSANAKAILAGRAPGVDLSDRGRKEAQDIAKRLKEINFSLIRVSPMERCAQTIEPLLAQLSKNREAEPIVEVESDLVEVDYGKWTGRKLAILSRDKAWKVVQNTPSAMYFPGGEGLLDVQARAMRALNSAANTPGKGAKLLVSHGDVIKSIVASVLGTHLDHFQKIVIDPASLTVLDFNGVDYRVLTLNSTTAPISAFLKKEVSKKKGVTALLGGGSGRKGKG